MHLKYYMIFFYQVSWSKDKETEGIGGWCVSGQSNIKVLEGNWRRSFDTGGSYKITRQESPVQLFACLEFKSDSVMESVTGQGSGPCHKICVIGLESRVGKVRIAVMKKMYHQATHIPMTVQWTVITQTMKKRPPLQQ
jgi:hypothetical protein